MHDANSASWSRGALAGLAGGLVASWVMNVFMERAGSRVQQLAATVTGEQHPSGSSQQQDDAPKEDATMKTADAVVSTVTGGRHLSWQEKEKGGPVVHYAFGALMGAAYGVLAESSRSARAGFGTVFASALFAGADLVAVPALNLSGSPAEASVSSLASPFSAHVVYGVTTEGVRRAVRAML